MSNSYPIWNEIFSEGVKDHDKSNGVKKHQETNIKIGTSKKNSFDFGKLTVKTFTGMYGTQCYQLFLDGELVKEASYNMRLNKFNMRSKIHPRDFNQDDDLFDFNTKNKVVSELIDEKFIRHQS